MTRENQDVQDNIPTATVDAPSAAKQPAPVTKGPDGQAVLKRYSSLLISMYAPVFFDLRIRIRSARDESQTLDVLL